MGHIIGESLNHTAVFRWFGTPSQQSEVTQEGESLAV
jgi:hypothetical protein